MLSRIAKVIAAVVVMGLALQPMSRAAAQDKLAAPIDKGQKISTPAGTAFTCGCPAS